MSTVTYYCAHCFQSATHMVVASRCPACGLTISVETPPSEGWEPYPYGVCESCLRGGFDCTECDAPSPLISVVPIAEAVAS